MDRICITSAYIPLNWKPGDHAKISEWMDKLPTPRVYFED